MPTGSDDEVPILYFKHGPAPVSCDSHDKLLLPRRKLSPVPSFISPLAPSLPGSPTMADADSCLMLLPRVDETYA
jgi:hypothetical protein